MITWFKSLVVVAAPLLLAGCISFSSSEPPAPDYVNACSNREQQCRDVCGNPGVLAYSCSAKPGEGITYRCECRRGGPAF